MDWVHFTVGQRGSWPEVKKLEEACRARNLPFSLIYCAADYSHLQRLNLADDATWYISVMRQGYDYAVVGGAPDAYVIQSWIPAPSRAVPETDEWTFTRSVRDFCERFVKPRKERFDTRHQHAKEHPHAHFHIKNLPGDRSKCCAAAWNECEHPAPRPRQQTFRVRFASSKPSGTWRWAAADRKGDPGIQGRSGPLQATANRAATPTKFSTHGFWSIPPGGRNLFHADGTARLLCADTAWALPWRATVEQAETYARDRQAKGFNAVLLMTVQPDMKATGPRSRTEDLGLDVGLEDLPKGTLRQLNPAYFQTFDKLVDILVAPWHRAGLSTGVSWHGWKGRGTAGTVASAEDYARYCRYLVARYGARPAIWLVGGDGPATDPAVVEQLDHAGRTIEEWDGYRQPTGIHYRVFDPRTGKGLSEGRLPDTVPAQAKTGPSGEPCVLVFASESGQTR